MWPKFIFPVIVIVYYWLLLSTVPLSTHFAVLGPLQCLLTFSLLFSVQKCNITGRVKIAGQAHTILQHWIGERSLIYFCKVNHSRILVSIIYVRYCRKIWGSQVKKIGSYLIFRHLGHMQHALVLWYLNFAIPSIYKNGCGQLVFYATHYVQILKYITLKTKCGFLWIFFLFVDWKLVLSER